MFAIFTPSPELVDSTPLSDFIRNAKSAEKKKIYLLAMQRATERQNAVILAAKKKRAQAQITIAQN